LKKRYKNVYSKTKGYS